MELTQSPYLNQIFRIDGKNKVSKIAGVKEGTGLKGNGILASQAELYKPISIDFDVSDASSIGLSITEEFSSLKLS